MAFWTKLLLAGVIFNFSSFSYAKKACSGLQTRYEKLACLGKEVPGYNPTIAEEFRKSNPFSIFNDKPKEAALSAFVKKCEGEQVKSQGRCATLKKELQQAKVIHRQEKQERGKVLNKVLADPKNANEYNRLNREVIAKGPKGDCQKSAQSKEAERECRQGWFEAEKRADRFLDGFAQSRGIAISPLSHSREDLETLGADFIKLCRGAVYGVGQDCQAQAKAYLKGQSAPREPASAGDPKDQMFANICGQTGGRWKTFSTSCTDTCETYVPPFCDAEATAGCECGKGRCSVDNQCVDNPDWHKEK